MTLFAVKPVPVEALPALPATDGKVSWQDYKTKNKVQCEDCAQLVITALREGRTGPPIRSARQKRQLKDAAGHVVQNWLFCWDHGKLRRDQESSNEGDQQ